MNRIILLALCGFVSAPAAAQVVLPKASPQVSVTQQVGVTQVTVSYHRPGAKKRTIWGKLVRYGEVWRAGANEATTVEFDRDVTVGSKQIRKGKYALFITPKKRGAWTIILNSDAGQWGSYAHDPKKDVARFEVTPKRAPHQEWLQFGFQGLSDFGATLQMRWGKLAVNIPIVVDTVAHVEAGFSKAKTWREHVNSAAWLMKNKTPKSALKHLEASIVLSATWYNVWLKAQALHASGDTAAAKTSAQKALTLGKKASNFKPNDKATIEKALARW
ncbi:MAG: hypothetical protein ACI9OJ_000487 [Myxococcota bacterium]|jgi:hypothetical protein